MDSWRFGEWLAHVAGRHWLTIREKPDADQAINTMNGEWLGSRAIRVNWANQKTQTGGTRPMGMGGAPAPGNFNQTSLAFDSVASQTPDYNSTVYVGNLIPYTTQADLIPPVPRLRLYCRDPDASRPWFRVYQARLSSQCCDGHYPFTEPLGPRPTDQVFVGQRQSSWRIWLRCASGGEHCPRWSLAIF